MSSNNILEKTDSIVLNIIGGGNSRSFNRKEYNRRAVKEYKTQSPTVLQNYLIERCANGEDTGQPFCETVFAAVMLADISGFTKLAFQLNVEELKRHINNFFTQILGNIIQKHKGDVIKFCGDAVLIMWSCPLIASAQIKRSIAIQATQCGLDLLQRFGNYESPSSGSEQKISLRLHCGMSAGTLHCMSLGTSDRMEFLVSGKILHEMGVAESNSKLGEICISSSAYDLVKNDFDTQFVTTDVIKVISPRLTHSSLRPSTVKSNAPSSASFLTRHKMRHRVYIDELYDDQGDEPLDITSQISKGVNSLFQGQIENRDFKASLIRYVHQSARKFILETSDFLAEIRMVATLFIQILNLDEDFNDGRPQRPQQVLLEVLDILKRVGGALRQYVVDDKGCVIICNFGVAGFSSKNDPLRAVSAAMSIRDHLNQFDIHCRIGVTQGMAYCGYVGSMYRKEYAVMGSSVNLAARLMGKANENQILVDTNIFLGSQDDFEYQNLPKVEAKGYSTPVQVYSPISYLENSTMEEVITRPQRYKVTQMVGRSHELSLLSNAIIHVLGQSSSKESSQITAPINSLKNKQMSLRATLSQIIEESSNKNGNLDRGISSSNSFHSDDKGTTRTDLITALSPRRQGGTNNHSSEMDNVYIIVGGPGYGKTTLINEVVTRNASLICPPIRINCHVSGMYEPYEVIGNLFEELMSQISPTPIRPGHLARRNSSPKRKKKNPSPDIFHSISEDEEGGESTSFRSGPSNHNDEDLLEKEINENLYQTLSSWIECNMPDTLFEYIATDSLWKGSASTQRMDSKDDDNGIYAPTHIVPERVASCLRSKSSRRFSVGSVGGVGISLVNTTKVYKATEVMSLLRICLNTEELPPTYLLSEFTSNGLEDMISSICSEVIVQLLDATQSRCLIIEDLHWCDKRSFEAIMLTLSIFEKDTFFLGSMRPTESCRHSRKYSHVLSSEGSNFVNTTDDLHIDCQILELHPFTKTDVKLLLNHTLGNSLIRDTPNILSDENVSRILNRSNSVPSEVVEQVKEFEMNMTRSKYGIIDRLSSYHHHDDHLVIYDQLTKESQMIIKIAGVCGMSFHLALLLYTLTNMGYTSLVTNIEKSLTELEDKNVIKRVHYNPESTNESSRSLVSVKSRILRVEATSGSSPSSYKHTSTSHKSSQIDYKKRYYTFLDKSFREIIYSLMLSTQRITAHAVIGEYLSNEYEEDLIHATSSRSHNRTHTCQDAETLAYHYSKANNIHKEIYYTLEAAKLFQKEYKLSTAYQHLHQLILLSTQYESIEEIIQYCCSSSYHPSRSSSYYHVFVKTILKPVDFGHVFLTSRYIQRSEFMTKIESKLDFISITKLSNFIAEMSILKYKLCDFHTSNNLFHLACHLRNINIFSSSSSSSSTITPTSSLLFSLFSNLYIKKYSSRCLYSMMFFYQGIISFLRGYPDNAFMLHKIALSILPKGEIIQKCQILSSLSTISLFIDSSFLFDRNQYLMKAEELHVSVQFKEALCYLKFHHSILHFINGDFVETQRLISSLASKYIPSKDFSPIRYQVENLLDWSSFAVGDIQFLSQRMSSTLLLLNGDDIPLGTMWYLELQSLCEILHGHYTLARQCLSSLGKYQMNHFGYYYQSTLLGFLMTCERKYLILSHDDPTSATTNIRYELFEKIIFSGKKLLERIQTSPIGMISLFLISYSALAILITTKEGKLHSTSSEQSIYSLKSPTTATIASNMNRIPPPIPSVPPPPPIRDTSNMTTHSSTSSGTNPFYESNSIYRPGGGTQYRLQSIAISCYHSLLKLSQKIPCLGILCDALELKFATFSGKKNSKFTMEYFEEIIYTMEYQQFAFGLLFWYLEKIYYCKNFNISLPYEEENDHNPPHPHPPHPPHPHHDTMTPTVPVESPLEIILQKYHIPENHFLLCQDFTIKKFSQTKRGIELSPHLPHHPSNPLSPLSGLSERKKEGGADGDGDDDVRDFIPDTITPFTPKNNPS